MEEVNKFRCLIITIMFVGVEVRPGAFLHKKAGVFVEELGGGVARDRAELEDGLYGVCLGSAGVGRRRQGVRGGELGQGVVGGRELLNDGVRNQWG